MNTSRILLPALVAAALAAPLSLAAPASADDATVLTYSNRQGSIDLTNISQANKLPGAPASFKQFARAALREEWQGYFKGRPACKGAPQITVTGLRTDGFAVGSAGDHPQPGCSAGGGYQAVWAIRHGAWKQVIGTQDIATCARLERFDIPSDIGIDQCADGPDVVTYSHP